jgi:hypothetical protein
MTKEDFEKLWIEQVQKEKSILLERASSYATNDDRLFNFKEGSTLIGNDSMQYGFNLVVKHIIAMRDLINKVANTNGSLDNYEYAKIEEYVTDIRNYAILLRALYVERWEGTNGKHT